MPLPHDILDALEKSSRTFFIPIHRLPSGLQEAVASAYLCMRAIDEIEDYPELEGHEKVRLIHNISLTLQAKTSLATFSNDDDLSLLFKEQQHLLPEVTLRLGEWACTAPEDIAPRIWDATAAMADRMAYWVSKNWKLQNQADLDRYTFGVAGAVGLLLCELWTWFGGGQLDRSHAIHFGRGLQAVNILRNHEEDLARGVDFFPIGWTYEQMKQYAQCNLTLAEEYARRLPSGPFASFIRIPLVLANATLDALGRGEIKLSRSAVMQLIKQ